eukprot:4463885-Pyramimonas_sp.AAC.1
MRPPTNSKRISKKPLTHNPGMVAGWAEGHSIVQDAHDGDERIGRAEKKGTNTEHIDYILVPAQNMGTVKDATTIGATDMAQEGLGPLALRDTPDIHAISP